MHQLLKPEQVKYLKYLLSSNDVAVFSCISLLQNVSAMIAALLTKRPISICSVVEVLFSTNFCVTLFRYCDHQPEYDQRLSEFSVRMCFTGELHPHFLVSMCITSESHRDFQLGYALAVAHVLIHGKDVHFQ